MVRHWLEAVLAELLLQIAVVKTVPVIRQAFSVGLSFQFQSSFAEMNEVNSCFFMTLLISDIRRKR